MDFKSPEEIARYFKNYSYPAETEAFLTEQAQILSRLLQEEIDNYYASYQPAEYQRTFNFRNSIRVSPVSVSKNGSQYSFSVKIYFDEEMATHPSIFNGEDGFIPILLENGFSWKNRVGPYRLAYYEGFHFVSRAISRFKRMESSKGITIKTSAFHNGIEIDDLSGEW